MRSLLPVLTALAVPLLATVPALANVTIEPTGPPASATESESESEPPRVRTPSRYDDGAVRVSALAGAHVRPSEYLYSPEVGMDVTGRLSLREREDVAVPIHGFLRQEATFQLLYLAPAGRTVAGIELWHRLQIGAGAEYAYAPPQGEFLEASHAAMTAELGYRTRIRDVVVPLRVHVSAPTDGMEGKAGFTIGAEF